jgi:hypothetical protein
VQFTVRLPDEYDEKIKILSKQMGLKKSDIARLALKKYIEENLSRDPKSPYRKVRHLIGSAESGISDLGQRHREHLLKKFRQDS